MVSYTITESGRAWLAEQNYETDEDDIRMVLEAFARLSEHESVSTAEVVAELLAEIGDQISADEIQVALDNLESRNAVVRSVDLQEEFANSVDSPFAAEISHMLNKAVKAGRVEGNTYKLSQQDVRAISKENPSPIRMDVDGVGIAEVAFEVGTESLIVTPVEGVLENEEQPQPQTQNQNQELTLESLAERVASLESAFGELRNQRTLKAGGPVNPRAYSTEEDLLLVDLIDNAKSNKAGFEEFASRTGRSVHGASYRWSRVLKPMIDAGQDPRAVSASSIPEDESDAGDAA